MLPDRCEVLVFGGGFAGLSCAIELASAGTGVVVDAGDKRSNS
ncbi:MAG: FAD-binding protein [Pseudomonadales bacterium]